MRYIDVYRQVKSDILSGKYAANSRLPYVVELMRLFCAGKCTIQHALNLLKKEGLVQGVQSKGTFVRQLNEIPVYNSSKRVDRIGFLSLVDFIGGMSLPYFAEICIGATSELQQNALPYFLIGCNNKTIFEVIKEINSLELNGLITIELDNDIFRREIECLPMPVVHVDMLDFNCKGRMIVGNNIQGGELALRKLFILGHKKILYLNHYSTRRKRIEPMGKIRWEGIKKEAEKIRLTGVVHRAVSMEKEKAEKEIDLFLGKYKDCTGLIVSSSILFNYVKAVLERRPKQETKDFDVVVFECFNSPEYINEKPVLSCQWDGKLMGRTAVNTLLKKGKEYPKIQYLPMFLQTP
ncbi:MAG: hypothetical protein A2293_08145 [Elusimicrobia bacterium RIFOXYB2_FULL_49_7]|nr:MAG: hypothetical protein A2293_08145 [Elusimicrobia bacterium RIFOXYB2_FULL_49_7]